MKTKQHSTATYSSNRSLETVIWISVIALIIIVFSMSTASATPINFEEEPYINDIPFNTEMVINEMTTPEFNFDEESYINDIPFNTVCVAADYRYKKAISVKFEMDDEENVNDMPFNTELIAQNYNYMQAITLAFEMDDEVYIDDIPFDTFTIANKCSTANNLYVSGK